MSVPKRILACIIRMAIRYSCDGSRYHTHTHRNYGTLSTRARRSQTSPFNPRDAAAAHARTHAHAENPAHPYHGVNGLIALGSINRTNENETHEKKAAEPERAHHRHHDLVQQFRSCVRRVERTHALEIGPTTTKIQTQKKPEPRKTR